MEFRRRRRPEVRVDLSALIDVVFLLLIFFAVSTTFLDTTGLDLELPDAETGAAREPAELRVGVDQAGRIRFAGQEVALEALEPLLRQALAEAGQRVVVLEADRDVPLQRVVAVMDQARKAGARGVTLAARAP